MDLDSLAGNHLRAPHAEITTEFLCRSLTALYFALVETFPDKEVSIRLNAATKVPQFFSPAAGDWIEAEVTPDMFAKTIHRSKPSYTMEGDILKVEGDRLLMQDPTGKEVSLRLTKDTKFEGVAKEGDQVRVEFTPDREGPSRPDRWLDRLSLRIVQSGGAI